MDLEYGIETSGFVGAEDLGADAETAKLATFYAGSQPGILRRVFSTLPDKPRYTLVDLGCGKGRPLVVASEFPFREIIGIDIAATVLAVARANAEVVRARFPDRSPITLVLGNAFRFMPENDRVVFFLYHPFGREGVSELVRALETKIADGAHVFVVYYNPIWSEVLDASTHLQRWSAETLPYDRDEIGYGMDVDDTVVIWQSVPARYGGRPGSERRIVVAGPTRAALED